jgi:hypothetical protein
VTTGRISPRPRSGPRFGGHPLPILVPEKCTITHAYRRSQGSPPLHRIAIICRARLLREPRSRDIFDAMHVNEGFIVDDGRFGGPGLIDRRPDCPTCPRRDSRQLRWSNLMSKVCAIGVLPILDFSPAASICEGLYPPQGQLPELDDAQRLTFARSTRRTRKKTRSSINRLRIRSLGGYRWAWDPSGPNTLQSINVMV